MNTNTSISKAPPERTAMNYAALRESGMELICKLAAETWTDHNVHDPGIMLLEAFSYAMTELGYRIQLDPADLLASGEAQAPAGLVPAHLVLPCGPISQQDLRRLLLDHPKIGDARIIVNPDGEIPFYQAPEKKPPYTYQYKSGAAKARPRGLFEVVLELAESALNSNTYELSADELPAVGSAYSVDIALPHWDEDAAIPFRQGATIKKVDMVKRKDDEKTEDEKGTTIYDYWRRLDEPQTYFGKVTVTCQLAGSTRDVELWAVLQITTIPPAQLSPGKLLEIIEKSYQAFKKEGGNNTNYGIVAEFAKRAQEASTAVSGVKRYLSGWRNLGEDPVRLSVFRVQEIAVRARIEVTGGADLANLLAEILLAIDLWLSPPVRFRSLAEMPGRSSEDVFNGPLLGRGFLDDADAGNSSAPTVLYASDILRLIMQRRNAAGTDMVSQENPSGRDIVSVTDLALSNFLNNRPITVAARDCLQLVDPGRYRPRLSLTKSQFVFVRNEAEVIYDLSRVEQLFREKQDRARALALPKNFSPVWPVLRGESLPVDDYYPFQNDLPRLYGVGEAALPEGVGAERLAAAQQLKCYLLLFEQFLADLAAQLGNINRFFSASSEEQTTYFTRALFDLPGMERLLLKFQPGTNWQGFVSNPQNTYRQALQDAAESRTRFLDRRNRMLDHLLARQGEDMVALGQELHRWAQGEPARALADEQGADAQTVPIPDLLDKIAARRQAVNGRLIKAKAAFLADLTELHALRMLAFGSLWRQKPELLSIEPRYRWALVNNSESLLRSVEHYNTEAEAATAAKSALPFAGQIGSYKVGDAEGSFRYKLMDGPGGPQVLAQGLKIFATTQDVKAAIKAAADVFKEGASGQSQRMPELFAVDTNYRWNLLVDGKITLHSVDAFATKAEATIEADAAGVVLHLALHNPYYYKTVKIEGGWRYQLMEDPGANAMVVGESVPIFATDSKALAGLTATAERFKTQRMHYSLTSLEQQIAHLASIRTRERRRLIVSLDAFSGGFFEIYDEKDSDNLIEKRWRLWDRPQHQGDVLLSSACHFKSTPEEDAEAQAKQSINRVLRYGMDEWNYCVSTAGSDTYNFELTHPANDKLLARRKTPTHSREGVEQAIAATVDHLYRFYSGEGFHLVEHLLLRPRLVPDLEKGQDGDPFLFLPGKDTGSNCDTYSHRLSLVFPSGYARDFSLGKVPADKKLKERPHRFRDPEFRRHVEHMVQQTCPAHLCPTLYWVDRHHPESGLPPSSYEDYPPGSFEHFEDRYFAWLESILVPGPSDDDVTAARRELIVALNAIAGAPVLTSMEKNSLDYEGVSIPITRTLKITNEGNADLDMATIRIANYKPDKDSLSFTDTPKIKGDGIKESGVLTLKGVATAKDWEDALRSVTYESLKPAGKTCWISLQVGAGAVDSNLVTRAIIIKPEQTP